MVEVGGEKDLGDIVGDGEKECEGEDMTRGRQGGSERHRAGLYVSKTGTAGGSAELDGAH